MNVAFPPLCYFFYGINMVVCMFFDKFTQSFVFDTYFV